MPNAKQIQHLFEQGPGREYQTLLLDGGEEPLYLPADEICPYHRIYFAHGYVASALHELAHWCQAGPERRALLDYGYWYESDQRSTERQAEFESLEAQPQAIEWYLSQACGKAFDVSADNTAIEIDRVGFRRRVQAAAEAYQARGWPPRAQQLARLFCQHFDRPLPTRFTWSEDKLCSNWD
ncbi:elongation factor P hydroxylase [Ferrimonas pelagia]|uniref:Elongation factor P hydroxylase n=1 Tax=Ferrimonas pelagia TaxID=1177826 RepID=A0ABP9EA59_9GAMM